MNISLWQNLFFLSPKVLLILELERRQETQAVSQVDLLQCETSFEKLGHKLWSCQHSKPSWACNHSLSQTRPVTGVSKIQDAHFSASHLRNAGKQLILSNCLNNLYTTKVPADPPRTCVISDVTEVDTCPNWIWIGWGLPCLASIDDRPVNVEFIFTPSKKPPPENELAFKFGWEAGSCLSSAIASAKKGASNYGKSNFQDCSRQFRMQRRPYLSILTQ